MEDAQRKGKSNSYKNIEKTDKCLMTPNMSREKLENIHMKWFVSQE